MPKRAIEPSTTLYPVPVVLIFRVDDLRRAVRSA